MKLNYEWQTPLHKLQLNQWGNERASLQFHNCCQSSARILIPVSYKTIILPNVGSKFIWRSKDQLTRFCTWQLFHHPPCLWNRTNSEYVGFDDYQLKLTNLFKPGCTSRAVWITVSGSQFQAHIHRNWIQLECRKLICCKSFIVFSSV